MPYVVTEFEATPNPNAMKVWVQPPISDRPISFLTPGDAGDDPIANRLFAIEGVTTLLLNGDWVTVNKTAETPWPALQDAVTDALLEL